MGFLRQLYSCFAFAAALTMTSLPLSAQTITLELNTGGFTVSGELLNYDGMTYTLRSEALGEIRVDGSKFTCQGDNCPQAAEQPAAGKPSAEGSNEPVLAVTEEKGTIRLAGSGTMGANLVPALIRDYAESIGGAVRETVKSETHVIFDIAGSDGKELLTFDLKREGSATAFPALASGAADIGVSDRPISDQEVGDLAEAGTPGMNRTEHEHVIGLDGIVILTSPKVFIDSLSSEEIAQIFSGEVTDWSELGHPPGKINVYATDEQSGTYRTFQSLLLRPFKKELSLSAKRFSSNEELAQAVAGDSGGIGTASFAEIAVARPVGLRDTCGLSYTPSEFSVKTREYPLSRNLYFYVRRASGPVKAFLDFATSDAAEAALRESGFIDDNLTTTRFRSFRDRVINSIGGNSEDFSLDLMKDLLTNFERAVRLSATMRFESGSSELDSESIQLLPKAADYLKALPFNEMKILVVGFSDKSGWFEANKELSLKRAQAVRDAILLKADGAIEPSNIDMRGYGELFPAACNDTEKGRNENRRVEIWLIPKANASPSILTKQF